MCMSEEIGREESERRREGKTNEHLHIKSCWPHVSYYQHTLVKKNKQQKTQHTHLTPAQLLPTTLYFASSFEMLIPENTETEQAV